jgi:hypothetical protein
MKTVLARAEYAESFRPFESGARLTRLILMEVIDGQPTGRTFDERFDPGADMPEKPTGMATSPRGRRNTSFVRNPEVSYPAVDGFIDTISDFLKDATLVSDAPDVFERRLLEVEMRRAGKPWLSSILVGGVSVGKIYRELFSSSLMDPQFTLTSACSLLGLAPPKDETDLPALLSVWQHLEARTWGPWVDPNLCLSSNGEVDGAIERTVFMSTVAAMQWDMADALLERGAIPPETIDNYSPWLFLLGDTGDEEYRQTEIQPLLALRPEDFPACLRAMPPPDLVELMPFLEEDWGAYPEFLQTVEDWIVAVNRFRLDETLPETGTLARKVRL